MLRGYKNFNIAGSASGLGLLLLAFLLVNPLVGLSASALEGSEDVGDSGESAAQAEVVTSTVSFAFGDPVGVTTLTPVSESGASARYSVKATVGVENSGGYTVYLGSNKSELTGKNSGVTINGVTSSSSYESLPVNSWGYNAIEGETAGTSFSRMPENVRGVALGGNDSPNIKSDSKVFTLSFAAHIGNDKPADTYENEVTLSVVSSPLEITGLASLTNMQEMTSAVCEASEVGETRQLIDVRDGKSYWVAKLKDNNCWMTQNLDLDIPASGFPDSATASMSYQNSDMSAAWTNPTAATTSTISTSTITTNVTQSRSWDQGKFILNTPLAGATCSNNRGLSSCANVGFVLAGSRVPSSDPEFYTKTVYTGTNGGTCKKDANTAVSEATSGECAQYDAHYEVGNWYTWSAVTAGTGIDIKSVGASGAVTSESNLVDAPSSICPKGWRLPSSGRNSSTSSFATAYGRKYSYKALLQRYNSAGTAASTMSVNDSVVAPLFFVRSGDIRDNGYLNNSGSAAYYWSSTAYTNVDDAQSLYIASNGTNLYPSSTDDRYYGLSARCVAR